MAKYDKDAEVLEYHGKNASDVIFRDNYGTNGYVGSIVAFYDAPEDSDIVYEIVANDDMTDIMEMSTYLTPNPDGYGQSMEYAVIYCMPVISIECWKLLVVYSVH